MEEKFIEFLKQYNWSTEKMEAAINHVSELKAFQQRSKKVDIIELLKDYMQLLIDEQLNSYERIRNLAVYYKFLDQQEVYIFFTSLLGGVGVIECIEERIDRTVGIEIKQKILYDSLKPPLGTTIEDMPQFTKQLMHRLKENLDINMCRKVLTGNNHKIPAEAFEDDIKLYKSCSNIDEFLKIRHQNKVQVLQKHCDENKIWFEQIITQPVMDFVKANQEILSAVRCGNKLYVTKIPYDTVAYLESDNDNDTRYHACHCPFAKASIKNGDEVDYNWCYCSAGFAKYPFEVILGEQLEVKVLKSPLKGDLICRFEIDLPEHLI